MSNVHNFTPVVPGTKKQSPEIERFRALFDGYTKAHGRFEPSGEVNEAKGGKQEGKPTTVQGPVPPTAWGQHLAGSAAKSIGVIPLRDDDTVKFMAIDVDKYGEDAAKKEAKRLAGLPVVVSQSKSGGTHIWLFFVEPVNGIFAYEHIRKLAAAIGYPMGVEIFPKQVRRTNDGDVGNWINLPYYGDTRQAFDGKGNVLTRDAFLDYAEARLLTRETFEALKDDPALLALAKKAEKAAEKAATAEKKKAQDAAKRESEKRPRLDWDDMPTCLEEALEAAKDTGANRNIALENCTRWLLKRFEGDVEKTREEIKALNTFDLPQKEIENFLKTNAKKNDGTGYRYKCPKKPRCNHPFCKHTDPRTGIQVGKGRIGIASKEFRALLASDPDKHRVFQQNGRLLAIISNEKGTKTKSLNNPNALLEKALDACGWFAGNDVTDPPISLMALILGALEWKDIPTLRGIINAPTIDENGNVIQGKRGYHAEGKLWLDYDANDFDPVPDKPTYEDAKAALKTLLEPFSLYKLADDDECHRSVIAAAILTGLKRKYLDAAPMFLIDAPQAESGKTKIVQAISVILTGREAPFDTLSMSEEEVEKALLAKLLSNPPLIFWDNIKGGRELRSEVLCAALTSKTYAKRILHTSTEGEVNTDTLFMLTGNNITVGGDNVRRTLVCRIDPKAEKPGDTEYPFDPVELALTKRRDYVVAGLTILREHANAGYPVPHDMRNFPSYKQWNETVRAALMRLGMPDPVAMTFKNMKEGNQHDESLLTILEGMAEEYGPKKVSLAKMQNDLADADQYTRQARLYAALKSLAKFEGTIATSWYGRRLRSMVEQPVNGLRLKTENGSNHTKVFWVVKLIDGKEIELEEGEYKAGANEDAPPRQLDFGSVVHDANGNLIR